MNDEFFDFDEAEERLKAAEEGRVYTPPKRRDSARVEIPWDETEDTDFPIAPQTPQSLVIQSPVITDDMARGQNATETKEIKAGTWVEVYIGSDRSFSARESLVNDSSTGISYSDYDARFKQMKNSALVLNIIDNDYFEAMMLVDFSKAPVKMPKGYVAEFLPNNIIRIALRGSTVTRLLESSEIEYAEQASKEVEKNVKVLAANYKLFREEKLRKEREELTKRLQKEAEEKKKKEDEFNAKLDAIKEAAELVHPGCWSFDNIDNNHFKPGSQYIYKLTILFPDFIITNSSRNSHRIKEFYLSLFFDSQLALHGAMYGRRGVMTYEEVQSGYGHSHCGTSAKNEWGKMCLGSGTPLAVAFSDAAYRAKYDIDLVTKILMLLHGYVNWESLEGGPHIKITNISRKNATMPTVNFVDVDQTYKTFVNVLKSDASGVAIKLSKVNNFNKFFVDRDKLEEALAKCTTKLVLKAGDGSYSPRGNDETSDILRQCERYTRDLLDINRNKQIYFKGLWSTTRVVPSLDYDNKNLKVVPAPLITDGVLNKLNDNINNYFLKNLKYEFCTVNQEA